MIATEKDEFRITRKLRKNVWQAMKDFTMIEEGDKVMVCLSGGKDSYTMLDILMHIQKVVPFHFDIVAVNLDQKQPGFPEHILPTYLSGVGVDYKIVEKDTYSIVVDKVPEGKTMCSLCSRLRRGVLYTTAKELGATKIALGHHKEDIIETFFLNLFFSGKLEAMPAKYKTDNGEHVVIRPLAYCREKDIIAFSEMKQFPIIPCNLCGSQPNMQRKITKQMLRAWEQDYPDRVEIIFNALTNVSPSHLLDKDLYDFQNLKSLLEKPEIPFSLDDAF
jgi:tRNA 2-thiocytidine biosynthesis protein TtcA